MHPDSEVLTIDVVRLLHSIPASCIAFILTSLISHRVLKVFPLDTSMRILQVAVAILAVTAMLRPHYSLTHSLHIFALHGASMLGILRRAIQFRAELEST